MVLLLATVVVTAAGVVTYRMLKREGARIIAGGGTPLTTAAPIMIDAKTLMMVLVSILVLGSSLYVILSMQYDSESQRWAFGVIGTILGFWLRPEK